MAQLLVRLKDRTVRRVPITRVATRIGRDSTNDVVIDNDSVSRHHAVLRYDSDEGGFVILDTSSHGLSVRGVTTRSSRVVDGDEVQIGKFTLIFESMGGVALDRLLPEQLPEASEPAASAYNPLPTMVFPPATKSTPPTSRPRAPLTSTARRPSFDPRPPTAPTAPTEAASPTTASVEAPPTVEGLAGYERQLRWIVWLLGALVLLLGALVAILLRR